MKMIQVVLQPYMVEEVLHRLEALDVPGLTLSDVRGWGRTRAEGATDRIEEAGHAFARKSKLEIVVADSRAAAIVEAVAAAARTGSPGDGKIFVLDVLDAVKIRTGERDEEAL